MVSLVRQQVTATEARNLTAEVTELTPDPKPPRAWICFALVGAGAGLLAGGAHFTVTGAVGLARLLGWSERIIGLTIVSAGTGDGTAGGRAGMRSVLENMPVSIGTFSSGKITATRTYMSGRPDSDRLAVGIARVTSSG
jgi:hypothetical protein